MNILLPIAITSDMILPGTNIPALDSAAGEILWTASGNYAIDSERVYADKIYACVQAHTATAGSKPPPEDAARWLYKQPTNRMSPFDEYIYTVASRAGEVKYVLAPGFITGFSLHGIAGDEVEATLRDGVGGSVLWHEQSSLLEEAPGLWEYLYTELMRVTKWTRSGLPLSADAVLEIVVRREDPEQIAEMGMISVGVWRQMLAPDMNVGGTQYGAEVTPKSYAFFKRNADGTYRREPGRRTKQVSASVIIDARQAAAAEWLLNRIIDTPVAVEASDFPGYGYLGAFGFVTGSVIAEGPTTARVTIKVDGNV